MISAHVFVYANMTRTICAPRPVVLRPVYIVDPRRTVQLERINCHATRVPVRWSRRTKRYATVGEPKIKNACNVNDYDEKNNDAAGKHEIREDETDLLRFSLNSMALGIFLFPPHPLAIVPKSREHPSSTRESFTQILFGTHLHARQQTRLLSMSVSFDYQWYLAIDLVYV